MDLDWDTLRVFIAVARTGRASGAARALGVEHSTVVRRVAALEQRLGVRLFFRARSGYRLTPCGAAVLADAESMERSARALVTRAREEAAVVRGRVRVAMLEELATHWLAPALPGFVARHPELTIEVIVGITPLDLSRGEAEIAVRSPRPRQTGLAAVKLAHVTFGLYQRRRPRGARTWIDTSARDLDLLVYAEPYAALQSAPWFAPVLAGSRVVLVSNHSETLAAAARAGLGIAVLPRMVGASFDDLVPVSDDVASDDQWLVIHPEVRRDPRVRAVAELLREAAPALEPPAPRPPTPRGRAARRSRP